MPPKVTTTIYVNTNIGDIMATIMRPNDDTTLHALKKSIMSSIKCNTEDISLSTRGVCGYERIQAKDSAKLDGLNIRSGDTVYLNYEVERVTDNVHGSIVRIIKPLRTYSPPLKSSSRFSSTSSPSPPGSIDPVALQAAVDAGISVDEIYASSHRIRPSNNLSSSRLTQLGQPNQPNSSAQRDGGDDRMSSRAASFFFRSFSPFSSRSSSVARITSIQPDLQARDSTRSASNPSSNIYRSVVSLSPRFLQALSSPRLADLSNEQASSASQQISSIRTSSPSSSSGRTFGWSRQVAAYLTNPSSRSSQVDQNLTNSTATDVQRRQSQNEQRRKMFSSTSGVMGRSLFRRTPPAPLRNTSPSTLSASISHTSPRPSKDSLTEVTDKSSESASNSPHYGRKKNSAASSYEQPSFQNNSSTYNHEYQHQIDREQGGNSSITGQHDAGRSSYIAAQHVLNSLEFADSDVQRSSIIRDFMNDADEELLREVLQMSLVEMQSGEEFEKEQNEADFEYGLAVSRLETHSGATHGSVRWKREQMMQRQKVTSVGRRMAAFTFSEAIERELMERAIKESAKRPIVVL